MAILINVVFAWLAVVMMALLSVVYILRIVNQKLYKNKHKGLKKINKALRKPHKWMGISAVVFGFIHGLYSTTAILTTNKGTILWLILIALGLSFYLRKVLIKNYPWIKVHRVLVLASLLFLLLHFIEVGWILGFDVVKMSVQRDLGIEQTVERLVETDDSVSLEVTVGSQEVSADLESGSKAELETDVDVEEVAVETEVLTEIIETVDAEVPAESIEETPTESETAPTPVETTPVETPPVEAPPVEAPPVETTPVDPAPVETPTEVVETVKQKYADGTYIGVANGFGPNLTVEVVVESDIIVSVEVIDHNERKEQFWGKPVREIPVDIVNAQSTDVDIISGATYTSVGIMNAVDNALSKALN